jgi:hypothetical protein
MNAFQARAGSRPYRCKLAVLVGPKYPWAGIEGEGRKDGSEGGGDVSASIISPGGAATGKRVSPKAGKKALSIEQQAVVELHPGVDSIKKYVERAKAQERLKNAEKQKKKVSQCPHPPRLFPALFMPC